MKLRKNNRQEKINMVADCHKSLEYWDEDSILRLMISKILNMKQDNLKQDIKTLGKSRIRQGTIDAKERALAAINMYCFENGIKTDIGYFYFASCKSYENFIKLGFSQDVEVRLQQYQVATPFKDFSIDKYLIVRNASKVEKLAIKYLSEYHHQGEWFTCDSEEGFKSFCRYLDTGLGIPNRFSSNSFNMFKITEDNY